MRLDLGPVTLDTDRHQVFRGRQACPSLDEGVSTARAPGGETAEARSRRTSYRRRSGPNTFVSDTSLTTLVNEIRTLLSETAREHRFIRTVHGYRLCLRGRGQPGAAFGLPPGLGRARSAARGGREHSRDAIPETRGSIPDASISRRHARITIRERDVATLEDLESKNGTLDRVRCASTAPTATLRRRRGSAGPREPRFPRTTRRPHDHEDGPVAPGPRERHSPELRIVAPAE